MNAASELPKLPHELLDDLKRYLDAQYLRRPEAVPLSPMFSRRKANAVQECAAAENIAADAVCAPQPSSLEALLNTSESTFSEHLLSLLDERGEKDSAVYRRAQISRQLFHRILSKKDYQPTKSTAIQLALGLQLDLDGTQTLLKKAGYALTRSSKSDLVVQYFIERKEYSVVTINAALYDCGLPLLSTGSAL